MSNLLQESYDAKMAQIRETVRKVVKGYATGCYIFGTGGIGKSYTVAEELRGTTLRWFLTNSRITGRGLFDLLARFSKSIHWIEDCETLLNDKDALGVLRSALWSNDAKRKISWATHRGKKDKTPKSFSFEGRIIIVANKSPLNSAELEAVMTRVPVLEVSFTNEETLWKAHDIYKTGCEVRGLEVSHRLSAEECTTVIDFIAKYAEGKNIDLRLLEQGMAEFQHYKDGSSVHWEEALHSMMEKKIIISGHRAERMQSDREIALSIHSLKNLSVAQKVELWEKQTGKSRMAYYRRLKA